MTPDLLKFYTRKAVIMAGTGRLHLVVIELVFSLLHTSCLIHEIGTGN